MHDAHHRPTALVIEDHEHLAFLLSYMLKREGFGVIAAKNGREAAEAIASGNVPDIVLMDLMLPYLNGFELIGLIRAHPAWKRVPIIVLSARTQEQDVVNALKAGANDFVRKPYQPGELMARIRRTLRDASDELEPVF